MLLIRAIRWNIAYCGRHAWRTTHFTCPFYARLYLTV